MREKTLNEYYYKVAGHREYIYEYPAISHLYAIAVSAEDIAAQIFFSTNGDYS